MIDDIEEQLEGGLVCAEEWVTTETAHGREQTRTYLQLPAPESSPGFTLSEGLMTVGIVTSASVRDGKESIDIRYYISSLTLDVKQFARAVRGHWSIENTCHWVLDVIY